jgi:5-hydroxyisourate hydrolase-like protein (transthyretin family)
MKNRILLLLLALAIPASFLSVWAAPPREEQWKQVDEAVKKGLPKTAIERLKPIIEGAIKDKAYAEAIRAIGRKIALEGNIQGNKPEEKITRMQAEIPKAPAEMKPVMNAIMAHWYWQYFQRNRWRFMQRTQTSQPPGKDFATWDLPRIFAEIDKHIVLSLSAAETLQKTPVGDYNALLVKGNVADTYRPTMYDFLAHEALAFYSSGEQAAAKAQDEFELSVGSPIFASADEFLKWKLETTDDDSPKLKAIRLYQELLKFHADDKDRTAWLDADLLRLNFGNNKAFGEEKNARYKVALKRFADEHAKHVVSSRAMHRWAAVLHGESELVEAHKLATQGKNRFPNSIGGKRCHNLIKQIEAKTVQIHTERVWNAPFPTIDVRYRNLTKVYFRAVSYDWLQHVKTARSQPGYLNNIQRKALLGKKPVLAWSVDLPATDDYQELREEIPAPETLKPGSYYLISSHAPNFSDKNNRVHFTDFWVSDLALVVRNRYGQAEVGGFVLDAITGDPIAKAKVQAWSNGNNRWTLAGETETDANGLFRIQGNNQRSHIFHVQHKDQALATGNSYYNYRNNQRPKPYVRTIFFTDRSLYRPGQTIQYKGLCIHVDSEADDYKVLPGQTVTVVFADHKNKEIARLKHKANDYGSFNGSFTAPRDRLMGRMSIRVDGNPPGATNLNVEEYKRPKFQTTLEAPQVPGKLNANVRLQGKATAYTGAAIDGAKVSWRVVRQVQYPVWWHWRYWWYPRQNSSQEIAHGTTTSATNGTYDIQFLAKPDSKTSGEDEPTFRYTVYADVTDTTGETRSTQRIVNVGYTALKSSLSVADWQAKGKPVEISVSTTTLDGVGQQAEGVLKIYRLRQPEKVQRANLGGRYYGRFIRGGKAPTPDPANINSWSLGEMVAEQNITTDAAGNAKHSAKLTTGVYRAKFATQDRFGKPVTAELPIRVLDPTAGKLAIKLPNIFAAPKWSLEPGEEFAALWGSGYDSARAFVEVEHRRKLVQSYWTKPGLTQVQVKQEVTEAMRGGFTVRVTMVRENRAYMQSRKVDVPWSNKNLVVKWEHFVSKLEPAQKETWTAIITGPDAKNAVAEMVAGLYDASLDAYLPHGWRQHFGVFRQDSSNLNSQFENSLKYLQYIHGNWPSDIRAANMTYRAFPVEVLSNLWGYGFLGNNGSRPAESFNRDYKRSGRNRISLAAGEGKSRKKSAERELQRSGDGVLADSDAEKSDKSGGQAAGPDLSKVAARKNLNETAFFFPHLISDKDGQVKLEFTMPEALTEWKFQGFVHDKNLRGGFLQSKVVTSKDLMIQPNPPRFVREGDILEFTVKVSNQSPTRQTGTVRLTLADARTNESLDEALGNLKTDLAFDVPSKESRSFSWRLSIPDEMGFLTYKAVGSSGRLSDGEAGFLPVLSRRILLTESLPLPIRGSQTKTFDFDRLRQSGKSKTLRHQSLTVEMVSNPSWYAVMALPYLMEFPHQCSEQVFNRLYANALARHIAGSDPKIRRVFDVWKNTPSNTLDSPLTKNQDLKAVMLEETPWLRQADNESQARRNVGILFDANRLNSETARALQQLAQMQRADGAWPWFPGGPSNDYITLYITTGFGRMRHLGVKVDMTAAVKSLARLDGWIDRIYREIKNKDANHLTSTIALYLYGRSFFLDDKPIDAKHKAAVDYFLGQARQYWFRLANRQSQAHLSVALKRFGDAKTPQDIMRSIKERSVSDDELGMFWRDTERSWWWYRAPIETQAMMIEAFDEVMNDVAAVEDCKVWLLKQKQTQDWKTTKATADAVYALLLRGSNLLASDELVQVSLGDLNIDPKNVEAGTGFYRQRFVRGEVKPEFGKITVKKVDEGVAWGSVHWQYLEDMSKVTAYEGTPLKLTKMLFTKEHTKKGPVLKPVNGPLNVGDELVVRVVLKTDRSMEYVHLKDQRGSGTEPVNVLSKYKFQDGLYYYESTRDTASHFFIDYLPKGVYVFEYSVRTQHRGRYQTGMAQIQCMYAPEFNGHSESFVLDVK